MFETESDYLHKWIKSLDSEAFEVAVCIKKQFVHCPCLEGGATQESAPAIIVCGPIVQIKNIAQTYYKSSKIQVLICHMIGGQILSSGAQYYSIWCIMPVVYSIVLLRL